MRIRFIFFVVVTFFILPLSAKKYGTFYFSPAQELTKKKFASVKSIINSRTNYFYREDFFKKEGKSWEKTEEYTSYNFINDSVVVLERFVGNKKTSTTFRHHVRVDAFQFKFSDYTENQVLLQQGFATTIMPLCRQGKVSHFYENGKIRQIAEYDKNRLVSNKRWRLDGEAELDNVYETNQADRAPQFKWGDIETYINQKTNFPKEALKKYKNGVFKVKFVILEDGSLAKLEVVNKIDPVLDYEAFRVVFQTKTDWKPGFLNGKPVKVEMMVEIPYGSK